MDVRLPDGTIIQNVPEGTTKADLVSKLQRNGMDVPAEWLPQQQEKPAVNAVGSALNDIPRQLGLTARHALTGTGEAVQLFTEPLRYISDRVTGSTGTTKPMGVVASEAADWLGLPKPQNATERVVADGTKLGFGTMAGNGLLSKVSAPVSDLLQFAGKQAAPVVQSAISKVSSSLMQNPVQQVTAAAGAGLSGGASREAGGGPVQQVIASTLGGVVGGKAVDVVSGVTSGLNTLLKRVGNMNMTAPQMDLQINAVLNRAGVDYSQVPEAVKQSMRSELSNALKAGKELDPASVGRLLDFKKVGLTPTRGMVTQDPVQITREMNLAKTVANTADGELHGLPRILNQNNAKLIDNMNGMGANKGDLYSAGQSSIGNIVGKDAAVGKTVSDLYTSARNMPGGDIPLDTTTLVRNMYDELAKSGKSAFLPDQIANLIREVQTGKAVIGGQEVNRVFDAQSLDNLMTAIATSQRGTTDGNVKAALGAIRSAIDKTPITPLKTQFGGGQLVTQSGANFLKSQDGQAGGFMDALNKARDAARQRFTWQESSAPVEAALGGAAPDNFIKKFVLNGNVADAQALATEGNKTAIRDAIVNHLKDKALNGAADEVGKFSQSAFNKALNQIGDRKLSLFFSPQELDMLRTNGRVAALMQSQPVGSAVNNSNSGALLLGRGYDALRGLAAKVPGGQAFILDPLKNIDVSIRQRQAQNVLPGLLVTPPKGAPAVQTMMVPGMALGGLLASPTVYGP